ncbi:MAG: NYN domain-containing protein [Thermoplasmata archaeon]|jgi:uncharacterized LabA/DUF88 family protein|nr:NYN domain-containing protein [Thermoplasmata archaeon]
MPRDPSTDPVDPADPPRSLPLAFLVDGDNATASLVGEMLAEAAKYGSVEIRRVYGDWASGKLSSWRPTVQEHALVPIQQFTAVSGKNATDSALIIDAMDILHGGRVRGFCIVSSDSDFTRLATRLRESGMFVVGVGRAQTPAAFRNACNVFVATENLSPAPGRGRAPRATPSKESPPRSPSLEVGLEARAPKRDPTDAVVLIEKAFDSVVGEDGFAHLAELGNALQRLDPAFDPRTYGKSKLGDLLELLPDQYEVRRPPPRTTGPILVRRQPVDRR